MKNLSLNPQKYSKDLEGKILFIRHGQTICNSDKNSKERKINPEYIDSHLSKEGIEQSKALHNTIKKLNIESIYVSPLYRTLETVQYILGDDPEYKGEITVHPLLIESLNCIDDLVYNISETKNNFKNLNVNWNVFDDFVKDIKLNENFYYFNFFNRMNDEDKKTKYNKFLDLYNNNKLAELKKEIVNEIPKIIFKNDNFEPFESFKHVYERFLGFKKFLIEKHKDTLNDVNKKIIVISHGDFISSITNKYLFEDDNINSFPKDGSRPKNCDIISIYI